MASAELQGKYQKLAQEYSKLRAQNQVLKKGVVDEQASSAVLKEQLKMKDQSLRKLQQEMDSLTFRNLQLAKRVELLQDELALSEPRGKKNKKSGESSSQLSQEQKSVFDEDLQKKIEENERLHIQFFEADEHHKHVEAELRSRLATLETEAAQHQAVIDGLTRKYMETIEKLQNDKARLEVKSQTLEKEAKECRLRTEECALGCYSFLDLGSRVPIVTVWKRSLIYPIMNIKWMVVVVRVEPRACSYEIGLLTRTPDSEVPDVESREDLIKNHYMARIAELTSQLQLADSKSVHFYAECRALSKRLALAEKCKENLTEEMKLASQNSSRLQDELTTTKRSYEDQLSMMSDHLCSMNETLSKQREEIDTLKMSSKGNSKKNRSR
nr:protein phosphatase 1 regulatory subunit 21 [Peromyscus maniculatus bairdii]